LAAARVALFMAIRNILIFFLMHPFYFLPYEIINTFYLFIYSIRIKRDYFPLEKVKIYSNSSTTTKNIGFFTYQQQMSVKSAKNSQTSNQFPTEKVGSIGTKF
jgi:hypothetical protein